MKINLNPSATPVEENIQKLLSLPGSRSTPLKLPQQISNTTYKVADPNFSSYLGQYVYQPGLTEEHRAQNQSSLEQLGRSATKFVGKTGLNVAGGTVGFVYGGLNALMNNDFSKLYDNSAINYIDNLKQEIDKSLPIYKTQEFEQAGFGKRLFQHPAQLSDDFSDAAAFSAGVVITGLLTAGIGDAFLSASAIRAFSMLDKAAKAGRVISGMEGVAVMKGLYDFSKLSSQLMFGAGYESIVETKQSMEQLRKTLEAQGIPQSQIEETINSAEKFSYFANMAVVGLSNFAQFPKIFNPFYGKSLLKMSNVGIDDLGKAFSKLTPTTKLGKVLSTGYTIAKRPVQEGIFEEGLQKVISETSQDYWSRINDPEAQDTVNSFLQSFVQNAKETYDPSNKEAWNEIGMGMLIGGVGSPGRGLIPGKLGQIDGKRAPMWQGGIYESFQERSQKRQDTNDLVTELNQNPNVLPLIKTQYESLIRDASIQKDLDKALQLNDKFAWKNLQHDQVFSWIRARVKAGLADVAKDKIESLRELTPEQFSKEIYGEKEELKITKQEQDKLIDHLVQKVDDIVKATSKIDQVYRSEYSNKEKDPARETLIHSITGLQDLDQRESDIYKSIAKLTNQILNESVLTKENTLTYKDYVDHLIEQSKSPDLTPENKQKLDKEIKELEEIFKKEKTEGLNDEEIKLLNDWNKQKPSEFAINKDTVIQALSDVKKIRKRRHHLIEQYNRLYTKEGQKAYNEQVLKQQAATQTNPPVEPTEETPEQIKSRLAEKIKTNPKTKFQFRKVTGTLNIKDGFVKLIIDDKKSILIKDEELKELIELESQPDPDSDKDQESTVEEVNTSAHQQDPRKTDESSTASSFGKIKTTYKGRELVYNEESGDPLKGQPITKEGYEGSKEHRWALFLDKHPDVANEYTTRLENPEPGTSLTNTQQDTILTIWNKVMGSSEVKFTDGLIAEGKDLAENAKIIDEIIEASKPTLNNTEVDESVYKAPSAIDVIRDINERLNLINLLYPGALLDKNKRQQYIDVLFKPVAITLWKKDKQLFLDEHGNPDENSTVPATALYMAPTSVYRPVTNNGKEDIDSQIIIPKELKTLEEKKKYLLEKARALFEKRLLVLNTKGHVTADISEASLGIPILTEFQPLSEAQKTDSKLVVALSGEHTSVKIGNTVYRHKTTPKRSYVINKDRALFVVPNTHSVDPQRVTNLMDLIYYLGMNGSTQKLSQVTIFNKETTNPINLLNFTDANKPGLLTDLLFWGKNKSYTNTIYLDMKDKTLVIQPEKGEFVRIPIMDLQTPNSENYKIAQEFISNKFININSARLADTAKSFYPDFTINKDSTNPKDYTKWTISGVPVNYHNWLMDNAVGTNRPEATGTQFSAVSHYLTLTNLKPVKVKGTTKTKTEPVVTPTEPTKKKESKPKKEKTNSNEALSNHFPQFDSEINKDKKGYDKIRVHRQDNGGKNGFSYVYAKPVIIPGFENYNFSVYNNSKTGSDYIIVETTKGIGIPFVDHTSIKAATAGAKKTLDQYKDQLDQQLEKFETLNPIQQNKQAAKKSKETEVESFEATVGKTKFTATLIGENKWSIKQGDTVIKEITVQPMGNDSSAVRLKKYFTGLHSSAITGKKELKTPENIIDVVKTCKL